VETPTSWLEARKYFQTAHLIDTDMPPKKPIKKKTASGYKMPDPIPAGMHRNEIKFN